jgi:iron complex transport system substrate-binding protein
MRHPFTPAALAALLTIALALPAAARSVEHAMGTTEVPDDPQRVVVLTNEGLEALLALGVTPVGAVKSWLGDPWYAHIEGEMEGVTVLGTEHAPNLELIAALQPDLIIGNKLRQEEIHPQLAAIAPTVLSETLRGAWQDNFALYAEALGREEEGAAVLEAFAARTASIGERLGARLSEEISLVRFMPQATRIYYTDTFAGIILDQIGFARPPAQDKDAFAEQVTKERIPEMEGDRLFYFVYETGEGDALAAESDWMDEPLWQALDVVKAGKIHRVDDAVWNTAGGVLAANRLLDDLEAIYGLE